MNYNNINNFNLGQSAEQTANMSDLVECWDIVPYLHFQMSRNCEYWSFSA